MDWLGSLFTAKPATAGTTPDRQIERHPDVCPQGTVSVFSPADTQLAIQSSDNLSQMTPIEGERDFKFILITINQEVAKHSSQAPMDRATHQLLLQSFVNKWNTLHDTKHSISADFLMEAHKTLEGLSRTVEPKSVLKPFVSFFIDTVARTLSSLNDKQTPSHKTFLKDKTRGNTLVIAISKITGNLPVLTAKPKALPSRRDGDFASLSGHDPSVLNRPSLGAGRVLVQPLPPRKSAKKPADTPPKVAAPIMRPPLGVSGGKSSIQIDGTAIGKFAELSKMETSTGPIPPPTSAPPVAIPSSITEPAPVTEGLRFDGLLGEVEAKIRLNQATPQDMVRLIHDAQALIRGGPEASAPLNKTDQLERLFNIYMALGPERLEEVLNNPENCAETSYMLSALFPTFSTDCLGQSARENPVRFIKFFELLRKSPQMDFEIGKSKFDKAIKNFCDQTLYSVIERNKAKLGDDPNIALSIISIRLDTLSDSLPYDRILTDEQSLEIRDCLTAVLHVQPTIERISSEDAITISYLHKRILETHGPSATAPLAEACMKKFGTKPHYLGLSTNLNKRMTEIHGLITAAETSSNIQNISQAHATIRVLYDACLQAESNVSQISQSSGYRQTRLDLLESESRLARLTRNVGESSLIQEKIFLTEAIAIRTQALKPLLGTESVDILEEYAQSIKQLKTTIDGVTRRSKSGSPDLDHRLQNIAGTLIVAETSLQEAFVRAATQSATQSSVSAYNQFNQPSFDIADVPTVKSDTMPGRASCMANAGHACLAFLNDTLMNPGELDSVLQRGIHSYQEIVKASCLPDHETFDVYAEGQYLEHQETKLFVPAMKPIPLNAQHEESYALHPNKDGPTLIQQRITHLEMLASKAPAEDKRVAAVVRQGVSFYSIMIDSRGDVPQVTVYDSHGHNGSPSFALTFNGYKHAAIFLDKTHPYNPDNQGYNHGTYSLFAAKADCPQKRAFEQTGAAYDAKVHAAIGILDAHEKAQVEKRLRFGLLATDPIFAPAEAQRTSSASATSGAQNALLIEALMNLQTATSNPYCKLEDLRPLLHAVKTASGDSINILHPEPTRRGETAEQMRVRVVAFYSALAERETAKAFS